MSDSEMTSNQPYLLRAMHEWIVDNGCTPYLYVDTDVESVQVPEHLKVENPLVISASYSACKDLELTNTSVSFQARFSGEVFNVFLPIHAVMAIAVRENGQGMQFEWQGFSEEIQSESPAQQDTDQSKGLKIVK